MKVTWLGQASLLIKSGETTILVDPYFSDSAASVAVHRKMPIDPSVWSIKPDILLISHDHIDHNDPETLPHFINESTSVTVISPCSVRNKLLQYKGNHNFVLASSGVVWTYNNVTITAVAAVHSDVHALGFIIEAEGKTLYITGDTLFCPPVLDMLPYPEIDFVFLPINGRGNNMNSSDAAKFADYIGAKQAFPIHFGMLDDIDPSTFVWKNKTIPEIYKEFTL